MGFDSPPFLPTYFYIFMKVTTWTNIYPEELQLSKENTDKHETSFLDLDIKIKDGKFYFGLFDKRDSFPFYSVRIPDKLSNVLSSLVYSAISAELLRTATGSKNPESFTPIKPLFACMSRQGVSSGKVIVLFRSFLTIIK